VVLAATGFVRRRQQSAGAMPGEGAAEGDEARLQKFTFKGYAPVPAGAEGENSQGVLWPSTN